MQDEKKRILIALPRQLGDVLLGTPIAQVLRDKYPNAQIDWWSHSMAKQILEQNPFIDHLFFYPVLKKNKTKKTFMFKDLLRKIIFLYENIKHLIKIRKQKYDIVIDAMNNPRTALLSLVTGAPIRISFSTNPIRNLVFNRLIPREDLNGIYLGHARLKLLQPLEINLQKEQCLKLHPFIPISEDNKEKVLAWMSKEKAKLSHAKISIHQSKSQIFDYILLSPTHRRSVRRWPAESYVELALQMIQKYQNPVVWLWGPTEDAYVNDMHRALQHKLKENNLACEYSLFSPLFSLNEAGFLSAQALIWIGNSNGLSHIAVAAGAKTLELHGPTSPVSWCHPDKSKHLSLQRASGCIQCESNTCRLSRRECLEDLGVLEVFHMAQILLEKSE